MQNGPTTLLRSPRAVPPADQGAPERPADETFPGDDDLLIARALAGDSAAFGALVERYKRPVHHLALRILRNPTDAEDAAQEAFVRAYVRLGTYRPGSNFRAWLLSITAHWCIDQRRRRGTVPLDDSSTERAARDDGEEPEESYLRDERRREMRLQLAALPSHYRKVLILRYWHDLSYAEVSAAIGQPISTVRMRLYRAHRRLKRGVLARGGGAAGRGSVARTP